MKQGSSPNFTAATEILDRYRERPGSLIEVLQEIHDAYGYIPKETVELTAEALGCSTAHIYGVLTFYTQFYLAPRGKHILRVCQGTACHVMGGKQVLDFLSRKLAVKNGETTGDNQFTLEEVACVGACGMAPVVMVDGDSFGNVTVQGTEDIISRYADPKNEEKGSTDEK